MPAISCPRSDDWRDDESGDRVHKPGPKVVVSRIIIKIIYAYIDNNPCSKSRIDWFDRFAFEFESSNILKVSGRILF